MDVNQIWEEHKKPIAIGGSCLGVIVFVWFMVSMFWTPSLGPVPEPTQAPPQKVIELLKKPAFRAQSDSFKLEYGTRVFEAFSGSPERLEQAAKAVENLSEEEAIELRENVLEIAKIQAVEDSQIYDSLPSRQEKRKFIDNKIKQMAGIQSMVTGRGNAVGGNRTGGMRGPNLATPKVTKGMPTDASGVVKMFVDKTSPGERAKLENYVSDVQSRLGQLKSISKGRGQ